MSQVEIEEAAATLAMWIDRACAGEDVVLATDGEPLARLVPVGKGRPLRQVVRLGLAEGQFTIPDDFDAPLPDDILDLFEGKT